MASSARRRRSSALGAVGLAALALASLHGPAIAGLGLVGAEVAPLLVSSDHPSPWPVVVYLVPVAVAAYALARLRRWLWLALATAAGGVGWSCLLSAKATPRRRSTSLTRRSPCWSLQAALAAAFMAVAPHRAVADDEAGFDRAATGALAVFAAARRRRAAFSRPARSASTLGGSSPPARLVAILALAGVLAATVAAAIALAGALTLAVARRLAGRRRVAGARLRSVGRPLALAAAAVVRRASSASARRRARRRRARRLAVAAWRAPVGAACRFLRRRGGA